MQVSCSRTPSAHSMKPSSEGTIQFASVLTQVSSHRVPLGIHGSSVGHTTLADVPGSWGADACYHGQITSMKPAAHSGRSRPPGGSPGKAKPAATSQALSGSARSQVPPTKAWRRDRRQAGPKYSYRCQAGPKYSYRCQVGPEDASWPVHPCGNTAIKGGGWPNFRASLASFSQSPARRRCAGRQRCSRPGTARARNRRFGLLSALRAHTKAP
jgi:hypothetical protein